MACPKSGDGDTAEYRILRALLRWIVVTQSLSSYGATRSDYGSPCSSSPAKPFETCGVPCWQALDCVISEAELNVSNILLVTSTRSRPSRPSGCPLNCLTLGSLSGRAGSPRISPWLRVTCERSWLLQLLVHVVITGMDNSNNWLKESGRWGRATTVAATGALTYHGSGREYIP